MKEVKSYLSIFAASLLLASGWNVFATCPSGSISTVFGAIFTTDKNGTLVNGNIYLDCCDVYLSGGPPPQHPCVRRDGTAAAGLPDGDYYFMVTDPSGKVLLSSDPIEPNRRVTVSGGLITAYAGTSRRCSHTVGIGKCASVVPGNISVQLMPFDKSPNRGNEYKAWMTPVSQYDPTGASGPGETFGFFHCQSKTDNFKCVRKRDLVIGCASITVECVGGNGAFVSFTPTVSGGSPPYTIECDHQSGDLFPVGVTPVTCTVTDSRGAQDTCHFDITVTGDCREKCKPVCPPDITVCNDPGQCSARVDYLLPLPIGECPVNCTPPPSSIFPVGTTTVTCETVDITRFTNQCTFNITVNDCEPPRINCPAGITKCILPGEACPTRIEYSPPTAIDNCQGAVTISCTPASGSLFPVGTTVVTCTATDPAGQSATCSFAVNVQSSVCGVKFYDANGNGTQDDGEPGLAGWLIVVLAGGQEVARTLTTDTGAYCVCLDAGNYTVRERQPVEEGWIPTTPAAWDVALGCPVVVNFGNVCQKTPGGHTMGFWSNKNGQSLITEGDLADLRACHLRDIDGSNFDPLTKGDYADWLLSANAFNMAYMLSAQLSATKLGVAHGFTDATVIVDGTRDVSELIAYADSLLANPVVGGAFAGANGSVTIGSSALRTEQGRVKNILDAINNGRGFNQTEPCPYSFAP